MVGDVIGGEQCLFGLLVELFSLKRVTGVNKSIFVLLRHYSLVSGAGRDWCSPVVVSALLFHVS